MRVPRPNDADYLYPLPAGVKRGPTIGMGGQESVAQRRLTPQMVAEIKSLYGKGALISQIAWRYKVTCDDVRKVVG